MKHALSLIIADTMNDWSLTIQDSSIYAALIPVSCPTLQVLAPGFIKAATFTEDTPVFVQQEFVLNLSACNLDLQSTNCGTIFDCLPDGIYVIRYSISPNEIVYVEYNHLRITQALKQWNTYMCELELAPCDPPADKKVRLNELMEIKSYLEAAKNMVEFCHKASKGMDLYNYALKRLRKMNCQNC
jgi:hypothetical protein